MVFIPFMEGECAWDDVPFPIELDAITTQRSFVRTQVPDRYSCPQGGKKNSILDQHHPITIIRGEGGGKDHTDRIVGARSGEDEFPDAKEGKRREEDEQKSVVRKGQVTRQQDAQRVEEMTPLSKLSLVMNIPSHLIFPSGIGTDGISCLPGAERKDSRVDVLPSGFGSTGLLTGTAYSRNAYPPNGGYWSDSQEEEEVGFQDSHGEKESGGEDDDDDDAATEEEEEEEHQNEDGEFGGESERDVRHHQNHTEEEECRKRYREERESEGEESEISHTESESESESESEYDVNADSDSGDESEEEEEEENECNPSKRNVRKNNTIHRVFKDKEALRKKKKKEKKIMVKTTSAVRPLPKGRLGLIKGNIPEMLKEIKELSRGHIFLKSAKGLFGAAKCKKLPSGERNLAWGKLSVKERQPWYEQEHALKWKPYAQTVTRCATRYNLGPMFHLGKEEMHDKKIPLPPQYHHIREYFDGSLIPKVRERSKTLLS